MDESSATTCLEPSPCALPQLLLAAGAVLNPRRLKARDVELRIDAEFRDVLPELSAASLSALRANLLAHGGCTNFILVWAGTDILIDGHNRYPLCREHDLEIWLGEIELAERAVVKDWIRQLQLARRDLSRVAASCVRGEAYNARKGSQGGDRASAGANGHCVRLLDAAQQVGEAFGVTDRSIRRDGRLAECVAEIVANCGSEARRAVLSPEHKVTRNGILRLAQKDADAQREAIRFLVQNKKLPRTEKTRRSKVLLPRKKTELVQALIRLLGVREAEKFHTLFAAAMEETKTRSRLRPRNN
jgi:hypothetical protein